MIIHFFGVTFIGYSIECVKTTAIIEIKNGPEISGTIWYVECG
jgi:hypothetical protein